MGWRREYMSLSPRKYGWTRVIFKDAANIEVPLINNDNSINDTIDDNDDNN